ncbi:hypothetical protein XBJ1_3710 [Xenorhabdus bovienii SS-2004]|uniref:Uncharacterized protein n=1 Tax=Xenorhabdus bovienii (strain SS-2004) TaxID=406818 RepID=D3V599_XENBS|nr:hypothetical protein XBJ1_3710 [Xenorhabdus bovienii SS-2004]
MTRDQNINYQPVDIRKPIDKSSPLLAQNLTNNERLTCSFHFYRTSMQGGLELYYKIKLTGATLGSVMSNNGDFVWLTCFGQSLVESAKNGVKSNCR